MGMEVHMLSIQYRMHPVIAEFPSWRFYNHKLETGLVLALQSENRSTSESVNGRFASPSC
eukprot:4523011-Amphidinium_carterae.1